MHTAGLPGNAAGEHGVGRVIARPFVGAYPDFKRTPTGTTFRWFRRGIPFWTNESGGEGNHCRGEDQ
jgi:hypothetical protein